MADNTKSPWNFVFLWRLWHLFLFVSTLLLPFLCPHPVYSALQSCSWILEFLKTFFYPRYFHLCVFFSRWSRSPPVSEPIYRLMIPALDPELHTVHSTFPLLLPHKYRKLDMTRTELRASFLNLLPICYSPTWHFMHAL